MTDPAPDAAPLRDHELASDARLAADATLAFIGAIRTPWAEPAACPRQGDPQDGPECRVEVAPPWEPALDGVEASEWLLILYWLHRSRRDLLLQNPRHLGRAIGTFALRSPQRPNPIGASRVRLVRREGPVLVVRGLDCLDGTPLLDIKPESCPMAP